MRVARAAVIALAACGRADDVEPADTEDTAETGAPAVDPAVVAAVTAAAEDDLDANNATGVQIAVWKAGALVWTLELGQADPADAARLVGPDTLFQIGSDTKKMTAIALLQQEAAGTLSREETVANAIPGLALAKDAAWADEATLHHLISHQGGLYDDTPWDHLPDDAALQDRAFGAFATNEWTILAPGAAWNYSNPNFSIAGLATETAAGRPWATVLEEDLFAPLGLTRTFARKASAEAAGDYAVGTGYTGHAEDPYDPLSSTGTWTYGRSDMADVADNAFTRPAGLVWSTASDMARFGGFLVDGDGDVLDAERLAAVTSPQVRLYPAWDRQQYGYGVTVYDGVSLSDGYHDVRVLAHGGNTLAFTSNTWLVPSSRVSISVLSNGYGDDFTATVVALLEGFGDLPAPTEAPPLPSEETPHDQLVGTYVDPYFGEFVITDVDGALRVNAPGIPNFPSAGRPLAFAFTDVYTFTFQQAPYDVTFVADDDGTYRWLRNRLFAGTRATGALPFAVHPRSAADVAVARAEQARLAPWDLWRR